MSRGRAYPRELRVRAVQMVAAMRPNYGSEWAAIGAVARLLGIGSNEAVRQWLRQAQIDAGVRPGVTTDQSAELRRLRRENAELRRSNEILRSASVFYAAELDRHRSACKLGARPLDDIDSRVDPPVPHPTRR
jgi:transposase